MAAPELVNGAYLRADLEVISAREGSTLTADKIDAFLDQVDESEEAVWKLTRDREEQNYPDPIFNCQLVGCFRDAGYFVYRLRPLRALGQFRILYAYDGTKEEIHLLAVVRKRPEGAEFEGDDTYYGYEFDHPISQRIRDEYDRLGLPKYH
ncbi:hypothetical protein [Paraburkholderia sp. XV]|uniref:hypothetical protein n=1 Tax=Paraburkholderia sp. XV TaxID=2831520 RepID=UPI001CD6D6B0|nr:hypothetical protein [Paraburkholderia sp. XV]